jgi:short-subunit dehydrogenase
MKRVWIVGGSSGIGLELVKLYLKDDCQVVVSSTNVSKVEELVELKVHYEKNLQLIDLDVSDDLSVSHTVELAWDAYNGIDIWLYNAGVYETMKIDHWDIKHFSKIMDINYMGAIRLIEKLTPLFEAQGFGRWAFNASLSSYFGLPYGGAYSASKAALVNLIESIQPELMVKNIETQIINHGFVKTRLTQKNDFDMPQLMSPETAAENIYKGLHTSYQFEIRFPYKLAWFLRAIRFMPYKFSLAITKRMLT